MNELISRSALIEALEKLRASNPHVDARSRSQHNSEITACIHRVNIEPTVEAKPVIHGEWIPVKHSRGGHECSVCNSYAPSYQSGREYISKYCPYCGADMRGEKHD